MPKLGVLPEIDGFEIAAEDSRLLKGAATWR